MYQYLYFYFFILSCSVLSYYCIDSKSVDSRKIILSCYSLLIIFFITPLSLIFLIFYIFNIFIASKYKRYFIFGYILAFIPLIFSSLKSLNFLDLVGVGFLFVRHYIILIDIKERQYDFKFLNILFYLTFFPTFSMGPLEIDYQKFHEKIENIKFNKKRFIRGLMRIVVGVMFVHIMFANLELSKIKLISLKDYFSIEFYLFSLLSFFKSLINFIGIIEIAIGSSLLFGIKIQENFNLPFLATNIQNFWKRYHITMGGFVRKYIYLPLYLKYNNIILASLASFILFGLWHKISFGFLLWGIIHGFFLSIYHLSKKKIYNLKINNFIKKIFGWIITFSIVSIAQTIAIN